MSVNQTTLNLRKYPAETLNRIKKDLQKEGKKIYDFGTGDPRIPLWPPIIESLKSALTPISQYPSILGSEELQGAQKDYLKRRFQIADSVLNSELACLPSQGSKEAIFHVALSLIGRNSGKKDLMIYPNPGYPVYLSSCQFAKGIPYPVNLEPSNGYLLEPWNLPENIQNKACAIWINYPHNPTGAMAPREYIKRLCEWSQKYDVVLLSDDCYVDIYNPAFNANIEKKPSSPIEFTTRNVISFFSLSKRSGLTGYRCGFMAGDKTILKPHQEARANFGVGIPSFIQAAGATAWKDDAHVEVRKSIFQNRLDSFSKFFLEKNYIQEIPQSTFYLWVRIPKKYNGDDVKCAEDLAKLGILVNPSQWLSEGISSYVRFAMVPNEDEIEESLDVLKQIF